MFLYSSRILFFVAHSDGAVEYTDCISAMNILDITSKKLMVRF